MIETLRAVMEQKTAGKNYLGETVSECSPTSLPSHRVGICSALVVTAKLFSKAYQITLSSVVYKRTPVVPHPCQHLALSVFFILSHFGWCVVTEVILRTIV